MKNLITSVFQCCLFLLLLFPGGFAISSNAQVNRQLVLEESKMQKRLALVIGNGNYENSPLQNPVNDANDMAEALRSVGFEVLLHTDINQNDMKRAISDFGKKLREQGGMGLFYFAGHGVQVRGNNYLIPIGAKVDTEEDVEYEGVDVGRLLAQLRSAGNSLNIVILDACRNNPFARSFRSAEKGLASIDAPGGTLIAYSTAPGSVASDGTGRNGLYTEELLKRIKQPGLSIENTFKQVRVSVLSRTEEKQTPWESSSLTGDFYFNPAEKAANTRPPDVAVPSGTPTVNTASLAEQAAWNLVKDSDDISDLRLYIREFPAGFYSNAAKFAIKKIEKDAWNLVKDAGDADKLQSYIDKYPDSENAPLARIVIKQIADKKKEEEAKKKEEEAKKKANAPEPGTVRANAMGMEFVWIPPGEFMMGSPADEKGRDDDEGPQRKIMISRGFWMGKYEVTQEQYQQIMGSNPSKYKKCGPRCPVEQVSWNDARDFIKKLNEKNDGFLYSLPTEAEWEYAARAGTTTRYSFGDDDNELKKYARYKKLFGGTQPVGELLPNPWGLYDIYGNVREWVEDIYNKQGYGGLPTDGSANVSIGDPAERVLRGGSYIYFAEYLRSANRFDNSPSSQDGGIGFRIIARPDNQ